MTDITIDEITQMEGKIEVEISLSGVMAVDFNVNITGDVGYQEWNGFFNTVDGQNQSFSNIFDIGTSNVSVGDEILVTAQTLDGTIEQDQWEFDVHEVLAGEMDDGSGGSDGSDDAGIGDISIDSYDISDDGVVGVDWTGSSTTNQSLTGYIYANVDGGEGYDEEFIEGVFYNSGYDSGSVELTPAWGDEGEKSVLIGARFELDGDVVEDTEQTTVEIDTGGGGDGPEPGGALEVKFINTNANNPSAGDSVEITAGYGPVQPGGLDNEWAGDLALYNGNDVIAQEPVTAIDDWKEYTFLVNLANPGEMELCAEVINQGQEL